MDDNDDDDDDNDDNDNAVFQCLYIFKRGVFMSKVLLYYVTEEDQGFLI